MSHTLLLADDSITIQRVIELTFAGEDVRVIVVGDGQQAIDRLSAEAPDIVLADIGTPKRSGYDVATFVKTQPALAGIPVLLLAGAFEALDEARVQASGADGVLVKPFEPNAVIGRVKELLGIGRAARTGAPGPGRLITSSAPPAPRAPARPAEAAARAPAPPDPAAASPPAATWAELHEESGPGPEAASVEGARAGAEDSFEDLDAAFDHLDARLSNPGRSPESNIPARVPAPPGPAESPVFEVEDEWFGKEVASAVREQAAGRSPAPDERRAPVAPVLPEAAAAPVPETGATFAGPPPNSVADAFAAMLADEQRESFPPPVPALAVSDQLVEEVTARVAERLVAGGLTADLRAIVVEIAERVVREEIRRVRGNADRPN